MHALPITTPSIVSAAFTLLARNASIATCMVSRLNTVSTCPYYKPLIPSAVIPTGVAQRRSGGTRISLPHLPSFVSFVPFVSFVVYFSLLVHPQNPRLFLPFLL